jgi:decaprenylphospho-beta-D-ribofuranose 2-oxidase
VARPAGSVDAPAPTAGADGAAAPPTRLSAAHGRGLPADEGVYGRPELLSGWGASPKVLSHVVEPADEDDVDRLFEQPLARGVIARGAGHCLGDAAQRAGGVVVRASRLSRLLEFDGERGLVTVEAGMSLGELMAAVVPRGWLPPVLPGTRYVTIGGCIAADVHGRSQHHDGNFASHVTEIRLRTPAVALTVGPDSMPDLFWATAGGMGLTGVILWATLRLKRIETSQIRTETQRAHDLDDAMARMEEAERRHPYTAAWLDTRAGGGSIVCGDHATSGEVRELGGEPELAFSPRMGVRAPVGLPPVVRDAAARTLNELVYRRAPSAPREGLASLQGFFHLHDRVDLFRLHAPRGFVEYQFVVPFHRADVVRRVLESVRRAGAKPFFGVLKRFGVQSPGALSFPAPGWMAAFHLPVQPRLPSLLHGLDSAVAEAGGRIYLAKDACARPEALHAMYPDLPAWRETRSRHDPEGVMQSDQARRLAIV